MIRFKTSRLIALGALLLGFSTANVARATLPNGWTLVGTTPGGGNLIVGSAANVGPLGPGTFPTSTSANGFDDITLNLGSVAMSSGNTITITTLSDTLTNNGTILGGGNGGYGVKWKVTLSPDFTSVLTNNGSIQGANGTSNHNGGDGIEMILKSSGGNGTGSFLNTGDIIGGNGTPTRTGGYGVDFEIYGNGPQGTAVGSLTNEGSVTGGNGSTGQQGIFMEVQSTNGPSAIGTLINDGTANGGSGSTNGGRTAIDFEVYGNKGVAMGTFINNGLAVGGSGSTGDEGIYYEVDGNLRATGIFTNNGSVRAGDGSSDYAGYDAVDMEIYGYKGSATGIFTNNGSLLGGRSGASIDGGDGVYFEVDGATTVNSTFINNGVITGGYSTSTSNIVYNGSGVEWYSGRYGSGVKPDVTATLINNGTIMGATGAGGKNGVYFNSYDTTSLHLNFMNHGTISGGSGVVAGQAGGSGIYIDLPSSVQNISGSITNYGYLTGGEAAPGQNAGSGVVVNAPSIATNITIVNWGAITPGAGLNQNAISINGSNNTVNLEGHSSTNGLIMAKGNVDSNKLNLNFTGVSPAVIASIKTLLNSEGVLNGHDSSGSFTLRGVTYTWDPLTVFLNLSSYQLQGVTPNQAAIGANLDSLTFNPTPGSSLFNFLNAIDQSGNVPLALEELSPQRYQIFGDIAVSTVNFMTLEIDQRLNNLRDGSESIDTMGIGGDTDKTTSAGYSKDGKSVEVPETKSMQKRWGFFGSGSGLFANVDGRGGDLSDAYFSTSGLILGVDGKVTDHLVMGLLFNYNHTEAELDTAGSTARVDTYGGGVYTGYHNGGWYGNGLASYGRNNYDSKRNINFTGFNQTATGSTNGNQYAVNVDGGYDFHVCEKVTVGPLAGLQYVHLNVDGFNESGAGVASLGVGSQSMDSLRSRVGVRANYHTQLAKEVAFSTEIRAAWQHEFLDNSRGIDGSFIGSGLGNFTVQTSNPQRDAALVGAGVNFTVRDTMTVFFDYDVQAGQESYLEHSVKGGLKFSF